MWNGMCIYFFEEFQYLQDKLDENDQRYDNEHSQATALIPSFQRLIYFSYVLVLVHFFII